VDWRAQNHLSTAEHHQKVATALLTTSLPGVISNHDDWVITSLFYSAVHYVTAYFFEFYGHNFTTHVERRRQMERDDNLYPIIDAYADLEAWSRVARYDANPSFSDARIQEAFDHLHHIATEIKRLLSRRTP
jgi:hypothetical protein